MIYMEKPNFCSKCSKCLLDPITGEESGCCENKTEFSKVDMDQSFAKHNIKIAADEFVLLHTLLSIMGLQGVEQTTHVALSNHTSTPLGNTILLNILNCIYRI